MGTQTDLTWPSSLTSPILTFQTLSTNEQGVQSTPEEMDHESTKNKRTRGDSSSSNEGDESNKISKVRITMNKPDKTQKESASPSPGEGAGGEGARKSRPPNRSPKSVSRSRSKTSKSGNRKTSPIKLP